MYCYALSTLEKLFHVYDGFVFPPHDDFWNKISNLLNGVNTKDSYGNALIIYLESVDLSLQSFDILQTLNTVYNIYCQLRHKKFLLMNDPKRSTSFCCTDQLDRSLNKVHF